MKLTLMELLALIDLLELQFSKEHITEYMDDLDETEYQELLNKLEKEREKLEED